MTTAINSIINHEKKNILKKNFMVVNNHQARYKFEYWDGYPCNTDVSFSEKNDENGKLIRKHNASLKCEVHIAHLDTYYPTLGTT